MFGLQYNNINILEISFTYTGTEIWIKMRKKCLLFMLFFIVFICVFKTAANAIKLHTYHMGSTDT
jgi:hypothetical protein